jgi:hypothetical protein
VRWVFRNAKLRPQTKKASLPLTSDCDIKENSFQVHVSARPDPVTLKMTYNGLPDAGNCVGGIVNDRVKVGCAELGTMQMSGRVGKESWRWDLETSFAVS